MPADKEPITQVPPVPQVPTVSNAPYSIALGDGAVATKPYELVVRGGGLEGRTQMSEAEHIFMYTILQRLRFQPVESTNS